MNTKEDNLEILKNMRKFRLNKIKRLQEEIKEINKGIKKNE